MRIRVPAANMPAGPQQLRIKFARSDNGIAYVAFGEEQSPGVMKAGTITNLCFHGQVGDCTTAVSLQASALYTEWFDYTIDTAKNYYVSYLHLCGPGGPSSGATPDGVAFSGYNTDSNDEYTYWSISGTYTWYNALRENGLASTIRGPYALVYGHYSRDPGASITGGWETAYGIEGIQGIESTPIPTPYPTPYPTRYPTRYPTPFPTPYPTPSPTPNPTPNPTPYPTPSRRRARRRTRRPSRRRTRRRTRLRRVTCISKGMNARR
ncbi:unnamed protein product [Prorocentrum cordatum]|uniref:Uncharacterized protein n=1 Tax=Prorocentrum cordatum TaxID=2364126 RepID=A0ABN9VWI0_9DINO|nr:unnamed protein product [Polarella glacialis]